MCQMRHAAERHDVPFCSRRVDNTAHSTLRYTLLPPRVTEVREPMEKMREEKLPRKARLLEKSWARQGRRSLGLSVEATKRDFERVCGCIRLNPKLKPSCHAAPYFATLAKSRFFLRRPLRPHSIHTIRLWRPLCLTYYHPSSVRCYFFEGPGLIVPT